MSDVAVLIADRQSAPRQCFCAHLHCNWLYTCRISERHNLHRQTHTKHLLHSTQYMCVCKYDGFRHNYTNNNLTLRHFTILEPLNQLHEISTRGHYLFVPAVSTNEQQIHTEHTGTVTSCVWHLTCSTQT